MCPAGLDYQQMTQRKPVTETGIRLIMNKFQPVELPQVIDQEYQKQIYNYLTDIKFDWHFMEDATTEKQTGPLDGPTPAFANLIYYNQHESNPHLEFFQPLIDGILARANFKMTELLRVRAGFLLNTRYIMPGMPYKHNKPHRDFDQDHYVAVYYVNETDGETVVFHETQPADKYYPLHKSMPQQGKALLFNGWHFHASTCPKVHNKRIAITINFVGEPL